MGEKQVEQVNNCQSDRQCKQTIALSSQAVIRIITASYFPESEATNQIEGESQYKQQITGNLVTH